MCIKHPHNMLYQICFRFEDQAIFEFMRFGVKLQYEHVVLSAQTNLKDYSSYTSHPIKFRYMLG